MSDRQFHKTTELESQKRKNKTDVTHMAAAEERRSKSTGLTSESVVPRKEKQIKKDL